MGLVLLCTGLRFIFEKTIFFLYPLKYEEYILENSEKYSLNPYLIMAVIKAESNYNPDARSKVAGGLMQITDDTARWIAKKINIPFSPDIIENPEINIQMGCYYLNYLLNLYSDENIALAAYNAGMGNVSKWLSDDKYTDDKGKLINVPFSETHEYLKRVQRYKTTYENLYTNKVEEES